MRRSLPRLSFDDARAVVAAVLGLLLVTLIALQHTGPEAALFRVLRDLPPQVRVVLLESFLTQRPRTSSDAPPGPRDLVAGLLDLPPVSLPPALPTLATLVVEDAEGKAESVVLVERSVARRAGLRGVDLGDLTAVGEMSAFLASRPPVKHGTVSPAVLRNLRAAPGVRVLVHPAWIARRFPILSLPEVNQFFVLWFQGNSRHLRFEGVIPRGEGSPVVGGRLLATRPEGAFFVLDGIPVSALFPSELPPLLEALRAETGVGPEFQALTKVLQDTPAFFVMQPQPNGSPAITAGLVAKQHGQEAVEAAVRALLARRLAIAQAVVETVRVNGRIIRHARPQVPTHTPTGSPSTLNGLEELHHGPWRILRAPKAAGSADLLAGFREHFVVIGNSLESLLQAGASLRMAGARDSAISFFFDGTVVRRVPAVAFALRGVSPAFRPWVEMLGRFAVEISTEVRNPRFVAEVEWSQPQEIP